jgi:DNA polymerase-3 subunit delta
MATDSKKKIPRAHLLKGDDEYRKQRALRELLDSLVAPDFADFDLEQLEGDTATCQRVMAGVNVPPFSSDQRVVLVKYANKMNRDEQKKLSEKLASIPDSACLIMVNPAPEKDRGKPKKGSEIIGELSRAIRKIGQVKEFGGERGSKATELSVPFIKQCFAAAGKTIDGRTVEMFRRRIGNDFAVINTESMKVINYSGNADKITPEMIEHVTSETPEEKIFKTVDAIGTRNAGTAVQNLQELFDAGNDPRADAPSALSNIARHFRLVWQMKLLQEAGIRGVSKDSIPENVKQMLPKDPSIIDVLSRQAWQEAKYAQQARAFTYDMLVDAFTAIEEADLRLKAIIPGPDDPQAILELLVMRLCSQKH